MDEVIFEEFKGTGNMELRLDRKLAERQDLPGDRRQCQLDYVTRSCSSTAPSCNRSGSCAGCSNALGSDGGGGPASSCSWTRSAPPDPTTSSSPRSPRRRSRAAELHRATWMSSARAGLQWRHHEDRHSSRLLAPRRCAARAGTPSPPDRPSPTCTSSCATNATPSTRASRSWSTPVGAWSASSAATASARPSA